MTSKEALEKLLEKAIENGLWKSCLVEYMENIILQDLEVLEILKKHSTRLDDEDWNSNIFNGIDFENLDEDEREIIKEWLENGN